jgi:hypothetical protein
MRTTFEFFTGSSLQWIVRLDEPISQGAPIVGWVCRDRAPMVFRRVMYLLNRLQQLPVQYVGGKRELEMPAGRTIRS